MCVCAYVCESYTVHCVWVCMCLLRIYVFMCKCLCALGVFALCICYHSSALSSRVYGFVPRKCLGEPKTFIKRDQWAASVLLGEQQL